MRAPSASALVAAILVRGYALFENPGGYDLNLVGVRSADPRSNRFDDFICVLYRLGDRWVHFAFPATTDPGTYYRQKPLNVEGTAVLQAGQYRGAYSLGSHKGKPALIQKKPVTVWRDNNQDAEVDTGAGVGTQTGLFGINIHRAAQTTRPDAPVDRWSAGCQVVEDWQQFEFLLSACRHAAARFGDTFTYTLLDESDLID